MKKEKKKFDVENAFANDWGCTVCLGCAVMILELFTLAFMWGSGE